MQESKGIWVAWASGNADFKVCNSENKVKVPEEPKYTLKRIRLTKQEVTNYYQGFSNRVLWPLFHIFVEKMALKEPYWKAYYEVNEKFANATIEEIDTQNDWIWIHDYHLALVPQFIKNKIPDAKIGFFWHIPWPPWEVFGSLPQRNQILTGILHSDLVGFHTKSYVQNFIECANKRSDLTVNKRKKQIISKSSRTQVSHFPLGISYKDYYKLSQSKDVLKEMKKIKNIHKDKKLILGIDRLDYTKGILDRIKAYEHFLDQNPDFRKKVVLIQIATPSRDNIEEYCKMKKEIDEAVGDINSRFGREDWTPIVYFYRRIPQQSLLAYYRAADVGLLTPIRDGMNLIAKEFTAARDEDGVLILSEFAGASEELNGAIMVNPYDLEETAGAIKYAVEMPLWEKINRFQFNKQKVKTCSAQWWLKKFLGEWEKQYD
jgi:trehalose 6-phosphate synthase/phosphatase